MSTRSTELVVVTSIRISHFMGKVVFVPSDETTRLSIQGITSWVNIVRRESTLSIRDIGSAIRALDTLFGSGRVEVRYSKREKSNGELIPFFLHVQLGEYDWRTKSQSNQAKMKIVLENAGCRNIVTLSCDGHLVGKKYHWIECVRLIDNKTCTTVRKCDASLKVYSRRRTSISNIRIHLQLR